MCRGAYGSLFGNRARRVTDTGLPAQELFKRSKNERFGTGYPSRRLRGRIGRRVRMRRLPWLPSNRWGTRPPSPRTRCSTRIATPGRSRRWCASPSGSVEAVARRIWRPARWGWWVPPDPCGVLCYSLLDDVVINQRWHGRKVWVER